jgi:hypothetical protein
MSYRITIVANTPEELDEKVRAFIGAQKVFVTQDIKPVFDLKTDGDNDDEMEEVPSPFANVNSMGNSSQHVSAPTGTNETGGAVDSEGVPWDKRIHSSSKKFNSDGTWRTARNLDKAVLAQVKAELFAKRGGQPQAAIPAAPMTPSPVVTPVQPLQVVQPQVAAPAATLPSPVMPTFQAGHTLDTFRANFPLVMSQLITEGKLTQEYVNQLKSFFNVAEIWQASPDQQQMVFEQFAANNIIAKVG